MIRSVKILALLGAVALLCLACAAGASGDQPTLESLAATAQSLTVATDTVWVIFAAVLVFFMQAGFAYVEAGFTRAKNASNILFKNIADFSIGAVAYWAVGFGLMFGMGNAFFGASGFFLQETAPDTFDALSWSTVPLAAKYLFQMVFAATAATIVSGAMAERTKFKSYVGYSVLISAIAYPISGHWIWGGGWLQNLGMWDFAGSTVVHSLGGWLGLVGAWMLGPRIGKYDADGKAVAIPGHSLPMAALGTFILWLGWFGFNPGSTMAADAGAISHIAVTTNMAAVAGALAAMFLSWRLYKKPDLGLTLNGALAGLVAITAGCAFVSPSSALIIGLLAGVAMLYAVRFFDKIRIDDPVGAISVHGVCGAMGTLAVGLFAQDKISPGTTGDGLLFGGGAGLLGAQAIGVVAMFAWAMVMGGVVFGTIKAVMGLRVNAQEEIGGLDIHEHGTPSYSEVLVQTPLATANGLRAPADAPALEGDIAHPEPLAPTLTTEIALVSAIIRPQELERVRMALREVGIVSLTATEVRGCGRQGGLKERFRGTEYTVSLLPKVRVDVLVSEAQANTVADAIAGAARTGEVGDGKVFISPVTDTLRVRTGERGLPAV